MGRLNLNVSDDLEKKFRLRAIEKFGGKRGSLSLALEEAIKLWLKHAN